MSYLLDTNVLSELVKPAPAASVIEWVAAQSFLDLWMSVLTLGELEKGLGRLEPGSSRALLSRWVEVDLPRQFLGRVLPIDGEVAITWGALCAAGDLAGRPLPVIDGLLLATAAARGLTLVTRNVSDCADRGVKVFDPWRGRLYGP